MENIPVQIFYFRLPNRPLVVVHVQTKLTRAEQHPNSLSNTICCENFFLTYCYGTFCKHLIPSPTLPSINSFHFSFTFLFIFSTKLVYSYINSRVLTSLVTKRTIYLNPMCAWQCAYLSKRLSQT